MSTVVVINQVLSGKDTPLTGFWQAERAGDGRPVSISAVLAD
jgi:hypothetical protein